MAGCVIVGGVDTPACANRFAAPGIERDKVWVFNKEEIASFTSTVTGEVDVIAMEATKVAFKMDVHKGSAMFDEELVTSEDSAPYYTQKFSAKIISTDTATMTAIEDMVDVDLVFVAKVKNGKFRVIGEDGGVKMTLNTYETGKTSGDSVGEMLEFTGTNNGKARFFFDTSEATSEVTLDALLTP
tara:strand:- start:126 stop:680 length:555 start_codon:yes stop_codon:yes gene_type:complete